MVLSKEGYNYFLGKDQEIKPHIPTDEEIVFGGCLVSPSEISQESPLERYLTTFINLDVRKHLGMTFQDYMNLTVEEMSVVDKVLVKTLELTRKEETKQEKKLTKDIETGNKK